MVYVRNNDKMQRDLKMSLINSLLALWTLWTTEPASKRCWMFILSSCYHVIDIVVVNLLIASNTYVTKGWGHSRSLRGLLPKTNWARLANRSGKVWKMFLSPLALSSCSLFSLCMQSVFTQISSLLPLLSRVLGASSRRLLGGGRTALLPRTPTGCSSKVATGNQ